MSVARQRRKSARKVSAVVLDSTALLSTVTQRDNVRVGITVAPRKVMVTPRVSISRKFVAPRIDMGEYTPVSTHAVEMDKYTQGF